MRLEGTAGIRGDKTRHPKCLLTSDMNKAAKVTFSSSRRGCIISTALAAEGHR